ncbi:MAG: hypothetical protein LBH78_00240 [Rickettsiales bacterium]|nr:hypothetical protein [Rickettsiales bacterium]
MKVAHFLLSQHPFSCHSSAPSSVIPALPSLVIPARDAGISFHFMTPLVAKANVRS